MATGSGLTSGTSRQPRHRVAVVGMVPSGASGVGDYGHLLGAELERRGFEVDEAWIVSDGWRWREALAASNRFLHLALSIPAGTAVVWNYSSFAYGIRGVPLTGVLFGVVRRLRGATVVTVLHEPTYPFGRRGWRGNAQALAQRLAFQPVLAGSTVVVVTTPQRADALRSRRSPRRVPVHSAPVFSTVGRPDHVSWRVETVPNPVVGVMNYTGDGCRPDVIVGALARLRRSLDPTLVLLGSPGSAHPAAGSWTRTADQAGLGDRLRFTGVLSLSELRRQIEACSAIVLPNDHGPSGRRTTLASALAHGVPTIALDGPERWQEMAVADALEIVPADEEAVAAALQRLLGSPDRQQELSANGRAFYDAHMRVERLGQLFADLICDDARSGARRFGRSRFGGGRPKS